MADKEFVNGLIAKAPNEKAPEWIKCTLSINRENLIAWLSGKTGEWINVDVKVSQKEVWYCEVNNWKPKAVSQRGKDQAGDVFNDDLTF